MTSPNRRLSLEEVLDEFFFSADKPSPALVLRACEAHPEFREDIMEFAALWSSYEAAPEPASAADVSEVPDESVSRLQSFVLNRLHELGQQPVSDSDMETARVAVANLAGGKLRRAAAATGLGDSTLLLQKVLTNRIADVPSRVLASLAHHLNVATTALQQTLGLELTGGLNYSASGKPNAPVTETWESAVRSLPVPATEKARLLALQGKEDFP